MNNDPMSNAGTGGAWPTWLLAWHNPVQGPAIIIQESLRQTDSYPVSVTSNPIGASIEIREREIAVTSVALADFLLFTPNHDTHACVDPGTGNYVVQLLVAGLLGGAVTAKIY